MFTARYPFEAKFPQSISFKANDFLLALRKENEHWLYVFHEDGRLGAVPTNYVTVSNTKSTSEISIFIKSALTAMAERDIFDKNSIYNYLYILEQSLTSGKGPDNWPSLPIRNADKGEVNTNGQPTNMTSDNIFVKNENQPELGTKHSPGISFIMLDKLRNCTFTSFDRCVNGFIQILNVLSDAEPQYKTLSDRLISEVLDPSPVMRRSVYARTADWKNLQHHIDCLERKAKDQQESSWPLIEDEFTVVSDLDAMVELLCDANPDMVCTCLADDRLPTTLSYLYMREKRTVVRRYYLLVLVATCHIQPAVWPVYLDSGLPLEILRELKSSELGELDVILDLRALTVLLARSNTLPVNLHNELNDSFFSYISMRSSQSGNLKVDTVNKSLIFSGDSTPVKDKLSPTTAMRTLKLADNKSFPPHESNTAPSGLLIDALAHFMCASNRHFCVSQSSPTTPITHSMLEKCAATEVIIDRLLLWFNRGVDPLSLNGVSFVRQLRSTLCGDYSALSQLCDRNAPYQESNETLWSENLRRSVSFQNGRGDVTSNEGSHFDGPTEKSPQHRMSLTDATLQLAPDTPRNAARKLLADIISSNATASLIYRNDLNVVVDVIIRQLCDLPANSPNLAEFIFCMDKIVRYTDYLSQDDGPYRLRDLIEALQEVEHNASSGYALNARDFITSRSMRLADDLLRLLRNNGEKGLT